MASITLTFDDSLYPQYVDAYCKRFSYTDNAALLNGIPETKDAFATRYLFQSIIELITNVQQADAMQQAAASVTNSVTAASAASPFSSSVQKALVPNM